MGECKHCSNVYLIKEIEARYNIEIYEIKFVSHGCGTSVWNKISEKIPFKKWSKRQVKLKKENKDEL